MKTLTIALSLLAAGVQAVEIDPITTRWTFGAHESFMMYRRVGNHCTGGIEGNAKWLGPWLDWWDAHAPEKMEEIGLNFLHSRFYKGMGWDVEKRDLPNVKKFVANCHAHGVKALGYVQFATLYPEAMRHEIPDVDDWASLDAKGAPNTYYGPNYFRTMPCIAFRKPLHAKFNAFAASHRAELTSPTVRSVRLFYPEREVLYSAKMNQNVLAAEEILIRNRVPFGYLIATPDGVPAIPSGTDVLVLPGLVALSDAQVAAIDAYAKAGGRLVVTGEAGRYDGTNAERFEDPLVHLKKLPNVVWRGKPDFSGEARYAWTSRIPVPKDGGKELMADLERAGYRPPVVLEGLPPHVAAEYRNLPDGRLSVHLINYDIRRPVTTGRVVLPNGARASVETPFDTDAARRELPADAALPPFGLYALLVVGTEN